MSLPENAGPRQLRALLDAVLTVGSDLDLRTALQRLIASATTLVDARYGHWASLKGSFELANGEQGGTVLSWRVPDQAPSDSAHGSPCVRMTEFGDNAAETLSLVRTIRLSPG